MSVLIELHLTHLRAAGRSPATIRDRSRLLLAADKALPYGIDAPTTEELTEFLATPGWSTWTRCTYFGHLVGFYDWATAGDQPYLSLNPAKTLTRPKCPDSDPDPVTDDELDQALARSPERWQDIITCAAYAGLRAGEIARLRREHINQEFVTVWYGKGGRTLKVPTHAEIWRRFVDRPPGLLVPDRNGAVAVRMSADARRHFDTIGMPTLHLHRFRHWFATMLLRQGNDIRTVQTLMRHKSLQTTAAYLLVADEQRRLAISTLPVRSNPQQEAA